jgi:hypothetical protein
LPASTERVGRFFATCYSAKPECIFVAFDLLNGMDLRTLALIERKRQLRKLLGRRRSRILYLEHVENDGKLLFEQIVKMDLEEWFASGRVRQSVSRRSRRRIRSK